jgi:putative (di)nucleoside polyphosphate hydrolase
MRFLGNDTEIDVRTAEPEFSEWRWLDIETLARLVVPFKRDTYAKVIASFRDLARPDA